MIHYHFKKKSKRKQEIFELANHKKKNLIIKKIFNKKRKVFSEDTQKVLLSFDKCDYEQLNLLINGKCDFNYNKIEYDTD